MHHKKTQRKKKPAVQHRREEGGAMTKLLATVAVLFVLGHAGFNYLMAAYQAEEFKQKMQETIVNAYAMPHSSASSPENVKQRLRQFANQDGVPSDAFIKVDKPGEALRARVYFVRPVEMLPFGLYKYDYTFDHTAQPNKFLTQ